MSHEHLKPAEQARRIIEEMERNASEPIAIRDGPPQTLSSAIVPIPGLFPERYCIILKSGARVYLAADNEDLVDNWCRFLQGEKVVARFSCTEIAGIIEPSVTVKEMENRDEEFINALMRKDHERWVRGEKGTKTEKHLDVLETKGAEAMKEMFRTERDNPNLPPHPDHIIK